MRKLSPAFLLIVLVVIGCKLPGALSGGGSKGATATGGSDPKADIVEASRKFLALPYFTANMDGMGQTEIRSQVKYLAPDRLHITYLGGTGAGMEMIYIGREGYMKSGDNWTKMPTAGQSIPNLRDSFTEEGLKTLSDAKFEGEETLDGESAGVYSYKNVTPVGDYPFTAKMWISLKTGQPMKIFAEYPNGVLKNMTVKYDTESEVTIEPPVK